MRKPFIALSFVALLVGSGLTACESPAPTPKTGAEIQPPVESAVITKSPNDDRRYAAMRLPNGLQAVLVSDPTVEVTAVSMGVGVGSYHDPAEQLGLAHYLEHMLFLGTEKYPEPNSFQKFVDQNAGVWNAFTAPDHTNYFFQLNAEKIDQALDYFSDYFKSPTFDSQYSDKERNAVNSEWSMGRSQDNRIIYSLSGITANPKHPAARLTVGNLETLSDKPGSKLHDELLAFYKRYYSADNMKLTIVGKQSIDELKALVEKHFSGIPDRNIQTPEITIPGITAAEMGKTIHYRSLKDLKLIMVEFPIEDNTAQWRLKPNEFIISLITSEEEGTAGEQLRKDGLVNTLYGYIEPDAYGADGYLRIIAELTDKGLANRDKVIASIFGYLELIKKGGVEKRYYRELQAMKKKDFENQNKPQPIQQAIDLSRKQFDYPVAHLLNADYVYETFDKRAIDAVLAQLQPQNTRIWHISKQEEAGTPIPYHEGSYSIRATTEEDFARWKEISKTLDFNLPPANPLFSDKKAKIVKAIYDKPTLIVNQRGAEAWLMHAQHYREDKGLMEVHFNVDFAFTQPKNYVLASLLNDLFSLQTTTLKDRAARAGLDITTDLNHEKSQYIRIAGYSAQQEALFKTLINQFANLTISEEEFAQVLDRFKLSIINAKKAPPYKQIFGHRERLLRLANWTDEEILAAADSVTREDVSAYHQRLFGDNLLRVYAFGNYTQEQVKEITHYAADVMRSQREPEQRHIMPSITPRMGENIYYTEVVDQTDSALMDAWIIPEQSIEQQAQFMLLDGILGNEIFTQLRTNEQMGYVVGSAASSFNEYPMFMLFVQSTNTDLAGIKARLDKFRKEFLKTLQELTPETLEQLKKSEIAKIMQKPTDFNSEATEHLADFHWAKFSFDRKQRTVAALAKVTKEDLLEAYQQFLLNQQGTHMTIQLKGTHFADKPFAEVK